MTKKSGSKQYKNHLFFVFLRALRGENPPRHNLRAAA